MVCSKKKLLTMDNAIDIKFKILNSRKLLKLKLKFSFLVFITL